MSELEWIKHDGGPMPVPGDTVVVVGFSDGRCDEELEASYWHDDRNDYSNWVGHDGAAITEYAIVTPSPSQSDPVNCPNHYAHSEVECIDAIKAQLSPDEYKGYLRGALVKYIWRYDHKGKPVEDLSKARWYLERLISEVRDAAD